MKLSDEQTSKLIEIITQRWTEPRKCPLCGSTDWAVDSTVFSMPEYCSTQQDTVKYVKPLVSLMCKKCGYAFTMNAIHLGVVLPDKKEDSK